jgi:hypothetical protein
LLALGTLAGAGCGDDSSPNLPDAQPLPAGVTVQGQIVRAPGAPVPIAGVTVTVIDPVDDPTALNQVQTDAHGVFVLSEVHPKANGRVRLFIDGTTGGGGPFVVMNTEYPVDATNGAQLGPIHLSPMDPAGIVHITADNADLTTGNDGRVTAVLKADVAVAAGSVPGEGQQGRAAQLTIPHGTSLRFPLASPLLRRWTAARASPTTS